MHLRDMRDAYEAGQKAYTDATTSYDKPPRGYALLRLIMSWRAGWLAAYWEDNGSDD